jgi:hypothetical protein
LKENRVENGVSVYDQTKPKPGSVLKSMTLVKAKAIAVPNVETYRDIYVDLTLVSQITETVPHTSIGAQCSFV